MLFNEFKTIIDLVKAFPTEQDCINHLELMRWEGVPVSPFDPTSKVYKCKAKYKCRNTGKYFTVKMGTIFENSNIPLQKWFMALYLFANQKKGISSIQLGEQIGVTQKTAWFMLHRLRHGFSNADFKQELEGIVEIDETYIGGREGNKHRSRTAKKKKALGGKFMGGRIETKEPVIGMVQRGGAIVLKHVPNAQKATIYPIIEKHVKLGTTVFTDEYGVYTHLSFLYNHNTIQHRLAEYVREDKHTNTIEGSFGLLKNNIRGIYHSTSPKHLQGYLNEFAYRYNTRTTKSCERFNNVLVNCAGHLSYKALTNAKA